jgi:hypothetical protein
VAKDKSDRLLVRSKYLTRCEWCGTIHSPEWIGTQTGKMFCSSECQSAANAGTWQAIGICFAVFGIIMFLLFDLRAVSYGIFSIITGFFFIARGIKGRSYKDRKGKYRNTQLLVCEYCNHINKSNVVVCQECGAPLTHAEFTSDSWPEWFGPPPETWTRDRICRNCGNFYEHPVLSAEGVYRCPKCAARVK